ncbi:MAG: protein kinase [Nitrososphaerota archaeon]
MDYEELVKHQLKNCGMKEAEKISAGNYSVYKVEKDKNLYALKHVTYEPEFGIENLVEVDIVTRIIHPYIIHAKEIITPLDCKMDGIGILLPLAQRTLYNFYMDPSVTLKEKLEVIYKIACAINFLHQNGILHLDVKDINVVLKKNHPYLIDFNLSMFASPESEVISHYPRVTLFYRPPENLKRRSGYYSNKTDVWSFGLVMLHTLASEPVVNKIPISYNGGREESVYTFVTTKLQEEDYIKSLLKNIDEEQKILCLDLIKQVLQVDPYKRISMDKVCKHKLFDKFRDEVDREASKWIILEPEIKNLSYSSTHVLTLLRLVELAKKFSNFSFETLFLAVDLFKRTAGDLVKTEADEKILIVTCFFMAIKILSFEIDIEVFVFHAKTLFPEVTEDDVINKEIEVVKNLRGIINVMTLYKTCKTGDEVLVTFKEVALNNDPKVYGLMTPNNLKVFLSERVKTSELRKETLTIKDYFLKYNQ